MWSFSPARQGAHVRAHPLGHVTSPRISGQSTPFSLGCGAIRVLSAFPALPRRETCDALLALFVRSPRILAESFLNDPERVAWFQREAQLLAALNHPHIASKYGLEDAGGFQCLVMELVEGEALAERLRRPEGLRLREELRLPEEGSGRPLGRPVDEARGIARQVADALAPHENVPTN